MRASRSDRKRGRDHRPANGRLAGPHFRIAEQESDARPTTDAPPPRAWVERMVDGVARRGHAVWNQWFAATYPVAVQRAWRWLTEVGLGSPSSTSAAPPVVDVSAVSAACLAAVELGQIEWAKRWLSACRLRQQSDGAMPDAVGFPSLWHTARYVQPALICGNEVPELRSSVERACTWLSRVLDETINTEPNGWGAIDRWSPQAARLAAMAALAAAARHLDEARWAGLVQMRTQSIVRGGAEVPWNVPTDLLAPLLDACLDLGLDRAAHGTLRVLAAHQRIGGAVPALPDEAWVSGEGLGRLACVWYRTGAPRIADRAVASLARRQRPDGSVPAYWGRSIQKRDRGSIGATVALLHAVRRQVAASFDDTEVDLPHEIASTDGRWLAVAALLRDLPLGSRIADVGCGPGRFLRQLADHYPTMRWVGIDASSRCLADLPDRIERRVGDLLRIPVSTGELDAAFCVEVLEHSLLPERAVGELCRTVRPGGRVLILDKDLDCQALSHHRPWEQWFTGEEVASWLSPYCHTVRTVHVPHVGAGRKPLFWCWTATRRAD